MAKRGKGGKKKKFNNMRDLEKEGEEEGRTVINALLGGQKEEGEEESSRYKNPPFVYTLKGATTTKPVWGRAENIFYAQSPDGVLFSSGPKYVYRCLYYFQERKREKKIF